MEGGTFTLCPYCGKIVDPSDPDATYGVEQLRSVTMGPTVTYTDGMGGWFHPGCPMAPVGFVERPRPDEA